MKEYKYIFFDEKERKPKTSVWSCRNKRSGSELGEVRWYAPWRQYVFMPTAPSIYSVGCLQDINDFISSARVQARIRRPEPLKVDSVWPTADDLK